MEALKRLLDHGDKCAVIALKGVLSYINNVSTNTESIREYITQSIRIWEGEDSDTVLESEKV